MIPSYWLIMLLCLSASSERIIFKQSGGNISFTCSSEGCLQDTDRYDGMYLYQEFIEKEEVFFFHNRPSNGIAERRRYSGRIVTKGSFSNHTVTIRDVTVDDSGVYTCVYIKNVKTEVECNVHTVMVKRARISTTTPSITTGNVSCVCSSVENSTPVPLLCIVAAACITCTLLTLIFIILITRKVKRWIRSRRMTSRASEASNEYEVMTKNGFHPRAATEEPAASPRELA